MIACPCGQRFTGPTDREDATAHYRAGCIPLVRAVRDLEARFRPSWQGQAVCRGFDGRWFSPDDGSRRAAAGTGPEIEGVRFRRLGHGERVAKSQWCLRCPVQGECLTYAFEMEAEHAIFGGTSWDERRLVMHLPLKDRVRILQELLERQRQVEGLEAALGQLR